MVSTALCNYRRSERSVSGHSVAPPCAAYGGSGANEPHTSATGGRRHRRAQDVLAAPLAVFSLLLLLVNPVLLRAAEPPAQPKVNGALTEVDGVRVLRVWGTPHERGYAHGKLLAQDILRLMDDFLSKGGIRGGPAAYENKILPMIALMRIEPQYQEELRGLLEGLKDALGADAVIPSINRAPRYEDLAAVNCIPDFTRMGCSSFAAWGPMTEQGRTITGRNLDWLSIAPLLDSQIILVQMPAADGQTPGWVSVTWPSIIGCLTGMNADGVTVSMHDVGAGPPSGKFGFTPRAFALREAIEAARGATAAKDAARVLRTRRCAVGNNVPVTWPSARRGSPSVVLEYDGDTDHRKGLTIRWPDPQKAAGETTTEGGSPPSGKRRYYQISTNHYRMRAGPRACERYAELESRLKALSEEHKKLDVDGAWGLLRAAAQPGSAGLAILTYHSVVFEPNERRMHVAFSHSGKPAPESKPIMLDVAKLLAADQTNPPR